MGLILLQKTQLSDTAFWGSKAIFSTACMQTCLPEHTFTELHVHRDRDQTVYKECRSI